MYNDLASVSLVLLNIGNTTYYRPQTPLGLWSCHWCVKFVDISRIHCFLCSLNYYGAKLVGFSVFIHAHIKSLGQWQTNDVNKCKYPSHILKKTTHITHLLLDHTSWKRLTRLPSFGKTQICKGSGLLYIDASGLFSLLFLRSSHSAIEAGGSARPKCMLGAGTKIWWMRSVTVTCFGK